MGMGFQGIAMGFLLLSAVLVSQMAGLGVFALIGQALALTALTAVGMTMYVWSGPKDFSMIGGLLSALSLPMLALMALSFVFPIGGTFGLILCVGFVAVSAAGLLYQINQVMHQMRSDMYVEGAYMVTLGILILFWNLLTLLMSLTSRD